MDQQRTALSVPEVAKRFGKSERTIRAWIHGGRLAAGRPTERGPFLISTEEILRLTLPPGALSVVEEPARK